MTPMNQFFVILGDKTHKVDTMSNSVEATGSPIGYYRGQKIEFFGKKINIDADLRYEDIRYFCCSEEPNNGNGVLA